MATKSKRSKKQTTKPESAPQPAPAAPAQTVVTDASALLALASDPTVTVPGWKDRRTLAVCELCGEQHQSPLSYLGRVARRGAATKEELDWLTRHLQAAGVALPASA
ncbi:MAG: hypothetical protein A3H96_09455 [Acidobacteria bacterium RIFCSPLOWO2_02_FULL_67_36]|nr:MAG: hypothetical protein A3H96_09455 [Acidobacteria bacterium RIFCSPLOWO2_02_FULL_67_36]OFW25001.1 MAG: hypothetical protein A3G21_16285 [Acidobacteria bacterium RIFCSPLOWO2_12_FULL_66_21]